MENPKGWWEGACADRPGCDSPICSPQVSQYSAYRDSKQPQQNGRPSFMMYLCPPRTVSHSRQQKCFMCQWRPSASVHSSAKIICKRNVRAEDDRKHWAISKATSLRWLTLFLITPSFTLSRFSYKTRAVIENVNKENLSACSNFINVQPPCCPPETNVIVTVNHNWKIKQISSLETINVVIILLPDPMLLA